MNWKSLNIIGNVLPSAINRLKKKAFEFLRTHADLAFATVGSDHKPKLRVFRLMKLDKNSVYFATSPKKEVYKQLQHNPNVELLSMAGDISVRISGKAHFDVPDPICWDIYNENPVLPRLYKDYQDLVYFRIPIEKLDYYDLSITPPTLESLLFEP